MEQKPGIENLAEENSNIENPVAENSDKKIDFRAKVQLIKSMREQLDYHKDNAFLTNIDLAAIDSEIAYLAEQTEENYADRDTDKPEKWIQLWQESSALERHLIDIEASIKNQDERYNDFLNKTGVVTDADPRDYRGRIIN